MKLLPKDTRVDNDDPLGLGIEFAVVVALFLGAGYVLDRIFDTRPIFMIVMVLIGAVGLFITLRYRYEARMDAHEAARQNRLPSKERGR